MGCWGRSKFAVVVLVIQTLFLILFAAFAEYGYEVAAEPRWFYPSKWDFVCFCCTWLVCLYQIRLLAQWGGNIAFLVSASAENFHKSNFMIT